MEFVWLVTSAFGGFWSGRNQNRWQGSSVFVYRLVAFAITFTVVLNLAEPSMGPLLSRLTALSVGLVMVAVTNYLGRRTARA